MEETSPAFEQGLKSPFEIGRTAEGRIEPFKQLLLAHSPFKKQLTVSELGDLRTRESVDQTIDKVRLEIEDKLKRRAEILEANKKSAKLILEPDGQMVIHGELSKQGVDVALGIGEKRGQQVQQSKTVSKEAVVIFDQVRRPPIDTKEEKIYRSIIAMLDHQKYNEASAFCLQLARQLWPKHEKRAKENIERRKKDLAEHAEWFKDKNTPQPDTSYWAPAIGRYLKWAVVFAKEISNRPAYTSINE